jgi:mannitol-specific phosphotransferase system IIBC component
MQENFHFDTGTKAGTIGGTLICILCNLHLEDLVKTAILAALGATVSFFVSLALKHFLKRNKK